MGVFISAIIVPYFQIVAGICLPENEIEHFQKRFHVLEGQSVIIVLLVQEGIPAACSLSSYQGIPVCLWGSRACNRRFVFLDHAVLQYKLYECIPAKDI